MKATAIRMKNGCSNSYDTLEIDSVYIEGCVRPDFYKKEVVYDYLIEHPGSIYVDRSPYPELIPALSKYQEKYVRSEPNDTTRDNLLMLPRK